MVRSKLRLHAQGRAGADFGNITGMVDDMVVIEEEEQNGDDKQQPWCNGEFEKEDREEKSENKEIKSLEASMEEESDAIAALGDEIAALTESIAELDKTVAKATEQRKEEHAEYTETIQLTQTAIELLAKAKNRLQKFYNPTLYKAEPKKEMTMEEKIIAGGSALAQVFSHFAGHRARAAQPEMPETFSGGVEKKTEKSGGVMALMDMITKELEGTIKDAEYDEKTAQKDYVELMEDCQASRAQDAKSVTDKEAAKADLVDKRAATSEKKANNYKDLNVIHTYVGELHQSCDFILENYDVRKEARTAEIEELKHAKAALSGAKI